MAQSLNRARGRYVGVASIFLVLVTIFVWPSFVSNGWPHEVIDLIGNTLIILCVVGRVYSTAFIGGLKNATLITYGSFSVCRNPLYFCSFLGAVGIGLATNHLVLMLAVPLVFLLIFIPVIRREEAFLAEKFAEEYISYCKSTPRLFPKRALYYAPETVQMHPIYLRNALKDATLWLLAIPLLELIEYLQDTDIITPIF